jgi:hypothetical protein
LSRKYKKAALIQIALAEAMRNCASSFFRLKPSLCDRHLRLKTEAIHKREGNSKEVSGRKHFIRETS